VRTAETGPTHTVWGSTYTAYGTAYTAVGPVYTACGPAYNVCGQGYMITSVFGIPNSRSSGKSISASTTHTNSYTVSVSQPSYASRAQHRLNEPMDLETPLAKSSVFIYLLGSLFGGNVLFIVGFFFANSESYTVYRVRKYNIILPTLHKNVSCQGVQCSQNLTIVIKFTKTNLT